MKEENNLIVEGKEVDQIFFPHEPLLVSHAEYKLKNKASEAKTCTLKSCLFVENAVAVPLNDFHVYAGNTLLEKVLTIPPTSELDIRITFPVREVHVGIRFNYGVQLEVEYDDKSFPVTSKLNITQER